MRLYAAQCYICCGSSLEQLTYKKTGSLQCGEDPCPQQLNPSSYSICRYSTVAISLQICGCNLVCTEFMPVRVISCNIDHSGHR
jgi:hypothetical protein